MSRCIQCNEGGEQLQIIHTECLAQLLIEIERLEDWVVALTEELNHLENQPPSWQELIERSGGMTKHILPTDNPRTKQHYTKHQRREWEDAARKFVRRAEQVRGAMFGTPTDGTLFLEEP